MKQKLGPSPSKQEKEALPSLDLKSQAELLTTQQYTDSSAAA